MTGKEEQKENKKQQPTEEEFITSAAEEILKTLNQLPTDIALDIIKTAEQNVTRNSYLYLAEEEKKEVQNNGK